jgi:hypothetical protein
LRLVQKQLARYQPDAPSPFSDCPELYDHLQEIVDAYKILSGRASGAMGTITLKDIIDYCRFVSHFEGTIKQFLLLFTVVENAFFNERKQPNANQNGLENHT